MKKRLYQSSVLALSLACSSKDAVQNDVPNVAQDAGQEDAATQKAPLGTYATVGDSNCTTVLELHKDATYYAEQACPALNAKNVYDIFAETGTFVDDGAVLTLVQTASTCEDAFGEYTWEYEVEPFRLFIGDRLVELEQVDALPTYDTYRFGCIYVDDIYQEYPLTCHATGELGVCD